MGLKHVRKPTHDQQQAKTLETQLLDTQEAAAALFEENTELKTQLLDAQEAIAALFEMGGNV
jgi:hypothetical protein